jgi:hypothetical protein
MLNALLFLLAIMLLIVALLVRAKRAQTAINAAVEYERLKAGVDAVERELKARSCTDPAAAEHLSKARQCLAECETVLKTPNRVLLNPIRLNQCYTKLGEQAEAGLKHLQAALDISRQTDKTN